MADSRATILSEAATYATEGDVKSLEEVIGRHQEWLRLEVVLRIILTYLPESVEPSSYLPLLQTLASWNSDPANQTLGKGPPTSSDDEPPQKLHLLALSHSAPYDTKTQDLFVRFLFDRAHRIDSETGSLVHIRELVEPFGARSEVLKIWAASTILPLLRLDYEFYSETKQAYSLETFERLKGRAGVYTLLFELLRRNKEAEEENYGRDFRGILGPWIFGEAWRMGHSLSPKSPPPISNGEDNSHETSNDVSTLWSQVFSALLDHAADQPASIVSLFEDWDGPQDLEWRDEGIELPTVHPAQQQYIQTMLALVYLPSDDGGRLSTEQESIVLHRAASILGNTVIVDPTAVNLDYSAKSISQQTLEAVSTIHLLPGELLDHSNPITQPNSFSIQLSALFAASRSLMASLEEYMPLHVLAALCLFGYTADQRTRMQKVLHRLATHSATGDTFWRDARSRLLWLRQWNVATDPKTPCRLGLFCRISLQEMETVILRTLAGTGRFKLLTDIYINAESVLTQDVVEQVLIEVAFAAYDNASSGNKTRGGMKKASDIIATFRHQFPTSLKLRQAYALIQATHALSFYTLTLEHGVICLPANIRTHPHPVSLLDKVLSQNPQSYTKLEDLIEIGRNFVRAGLTFSQRDEAGTGDTEQAILQMERLVVAKAINAAIAEDDFDTAYSYVVNRLSTNSASGSEQDQDDDLLWRAALQAGRYRSNMTDGPSKLRRIEQRMELLSQAALIAPPTGLQEVLETWRSCEAEFNSSKAQAIAEEEEWNDKGDRTIPGGFSANDMLPLPQKSRESTGRAVREEAPMGLFDVARGAAAAFSKTAFVDSEGRRDGPPGRLPSAQHLQQTPGQEEGRVRRRDMVSNAVTGGLVSGIGWVLGANSTPER